jgi:hypothetical protein
MGRIVGFASRPEHHRQYRRLLVRRGLAVAVPVAGLLVIDVTDRLTWLRPVLLLLPLLDLRNQLNIWRLHVRRFGFPSFGDLRRMLRLDTMRGYTGRSAANAKHKRSHVVVHLAWSILVTGGCVILWRVTGFATFLFPAVVVVMLAAKAVIRRARPPAVLVLGASGETTSRVVLRVMRTAHPYVAVAALHHDPRSVLEDEVLAFFSYRTGDDAVWQEMVSGLVDLSQVVVVDVRVATFPVEFEINYSVKHVVDDRLFFVGEPEHPAIPRSRCMTEGRLVEALHAVLWGDAEPTPHRGRKAKRTARWVDTRNRYFAFEPPPGWIAHEQDDVRTKVRFNHPQAPEVYVSFVVRQATGESHMPPAAALANARAMGFTCETRQSTMLGVPCSEVRMSSPHRGVSVLWLFVSDGLHFNIQYWAPTEAAFRAHRTAVVRSLESIEVFGPSGSTVAAGEEKLAGRLRYARLAAAEIDVIEALRALAEARVEFAGDTGALARIDAVAAELEQSQDR